MVDYSIKSVKAREVLDSRGNPTVEVEISTDAGVSRAMVPSGASTGVHEALELRDGGERFLGKGVLTAVDNVSTILAKQVVGLDCRDQRQLDQQMLELDGTENKSNLGANSILGVSMAAARAGALAKGVPLYRHLADVYEGGRLLLPVPSMNVVNGGQHAGNNLDIQEYMMLPVGASSFREAVEVCGEVYQSLKNIIKKKYGKDAVNVGDEGGFAPPLDRPEEPIELILEAVQERGYEDKVKVGLDSAASSFYNDGKYELAGELLSSEELVERYKQMAEDYPLVSYEDPFEEEDFEAFAALTREVGDRVQVVGDDLLVTNVSRIKTAIEKSACNALLLKVNQIGSVSEAMDATKLARSSGWGVMVSHRSGETEDTFIADLVVGWATGQIKSGAPCRSERTAKYNQLLRIEEELGDEAVYAGENFKNP